MKEFAQENILKKKKPGQSGEVINLCFMNNNLGDSIKYGSQVEPLSLLIDTNIETPDFLQIPKYSRETVAKLSSTFGSEEILDSVIAEWQAGERLT